VILNDEAKAARGQVGRRGLRASAEADRGRPADRLAIVAERRERLARKLRDATDEETRLRLQAQMLSIALRLRRSAKAGAEQTSVAAAPRRHEPTLAADVLTIVRQGQGAPVTPRQVRDRLTQLGIDRSERVIRTALRRWAERGMLVKDGHVYRALAP
jgi:hypothetical protein